LGENKNIYRSQVRISAGSNCDNFNRVIEVGIPPDNIIILPTTIIASHVKITVLASDTSVDASASPVGVNGYFHPVQMLLVLRSFVGVQITDRQNVNIQIVCRHKNVDFIINLH
jgi:hypothetical protein